VPLRLAIRCGRCGGRYRNPLTHVCATRLDKPRRARKSTAEVSASLTCSRCGKSYANPLTHVCTVKTDFRRRSAAAGKAKARAAKRTHPRPSACRDRDCERAACAAYRDGFADGAASAGGGE
jgi:hypothetical protein